MRHYLPLLKGCLPRTNFIEKANCKVLFICVMCIKGNNGLIQPSKLDFRMKVSGIWEATSIHMVNIMNQSEPEEDINWGEKPNMHLCF